MLLSLFSSVALASLIVAESVRRKSPPLIACADVNNGTLSLTSLDNAPIPISTPLALALDPVTGLLIPGDVPQQFTFQGCFSAFMGGTGAYNGGHYLDWYGIIALADNPNLCIGIKNTVDLWWEQSINTNNCSLSDNFSQMYQFWKLTSFLESSTNIFVFVGDPTWPKTHCTTDADQSQGTWDINLQCYNTGRAYYQINFIPSEPLRLRRS